jgi:hypothetical protein
VVRWRPAMIDRRAAIKSHDRVWITGISLGIGTSGRNYRTDYRHCEQSEAIQSAAQLLDCFVASLLAMTTQTQVYLPRVDSPREFNGVNNGLFRSLALRRILDRIVPAGIEAKEIP